MEIVSSFSQKFSKQDKTRGLVFILLIVSHLSCWSKTYNDKFFAKSLPVVALFKELLFHY